MKANKRTIKEKGEQQSKEGIFYCREVFCMLVGREECQRGQSNKANKDRCYRCESIFKNQFSAGTGETGKIIVGIKKFHCPHLGGPIEREKCLAFCAVKKQNLDICSALLCRCPWRICYLCVQKELFKPVMIESKKAVEACRVFNAEEGLCNLHHREFSKEFIYERMSDLEKDEEITEETENIPGVDPGKEEEKNNMGRENVKTWKKMSKEEKLQAMKDEAAQGKTVAEAAQAYGVSDQTPRNYEAKHGIKFTPAVAGKKGFTKKEKVQKKEIMKKTGTKETGTEDSQKFDKSIQKADASTVTKTVNKGNRIKIMMMALRRLRFIQKQEAGLQSRVLMSWQRDVYSLNNSGIKLKGVYEIYAL